MKFVFVLAFAALASPALADDCARYDDPLAYNMCLAKRGPAARPAHVKPMAPDAAYRAPPRTEGRRDTSLGRRPRGRIAGRSGRGRSELVFSVGR